MWVHAALYFDGIPTERWAKNLALNPALTVHLESGDEVVVLEGFSEDLHTDVPLPERIINA